MKWEDINFNAGTIQVRRSLPISNELLQVLKSHQKRQKAAKLKVGELWQENNLVFCSGIGTPFDPRKLTDSFYQATEKAGLEKTNFHSLRHCFCSRALEAGIELKRCPN